MADIIRIPGSVEVPSKLKMFKRQWAWKLPALGHIKINVGRSFLGFSGRESIGVIVWDSDGKVLLHFSKKVWVDSVVHTVVLALWEELLVAASRWDSSNSFVFESDSKFVVVRVVDLFSAPWQFHNLVHEGCHVFGFSIRWSLSYIV